MERTVQFSGDKSFMVTYTRRLLFALSLTQLKTP